MSLRKKFISRDEKVQIVRQVKKESGCELVEVASGGLRKVVEI